MRARFFLFAAATTLAAAAFAVQACSSSSEAPAAPADSGSDVTVVDSAPPKEAAPPEQDSATCDLSADFTSSIPDASIADGATTSGICLGCSHDKCAKDLAACNEDCTCQNVAGSTLDCVLKNAGKSYQEIATACGGAILSLDSNTQKLLLNLVGCLNDSCKTECAVDAFKPQDGGSDADAN